MVRSDLGERYELAICRPGPGDVESMQALDRGTARGIVDPLRGRMREQFDPRENPFQSSEERPAGGGYYVGIRAIQGQSVTGVLDLRLCVPICDRYRCFFDLAWHATNWDCVRGILERGLVPGGDGHRGHVYFQRVPRNSPNYRAGSRAYCDVYVHVDCKALLDRLPCYITRSACVITRKMWSVTS